MKKITFLAAITVLIASITFISCRKSQRDSDTETQSTSDQALAEFIFNDVYKQVFIANNYDTTLTSLACDTSYFTPAFPDSTFPKTLTIRFDTVNGCTGSDGITRKGTITAVITGFMYDSLSMATISFNKYYVNGNKVTGTKIITYKGHNSNGNPYYTVSVSNASVILSNGDLISWKSSRTREWIAGDTTSVMSDDVYLITGTASGTGINGNTFTVTTNTALRVEIGCKYPTSGIITLQPANLLPRTIDFGTGTCDDAAVVKLGGKSYDVTLP
jgi:hypothetical protein